MFNDSQSRKRHHIPKDMIKPDIMSHSLPLSYLSDPYCFFWYQESALFDLELSGKRIVGLKVHATTEL